MSLKFDAHCQIFFPLVIIFPPPSTMKLCHRYFACRTRRMRNILLCMQLRSSLDQDEFKATNAQNRQRTNLILFSKMLRRQDTGCRTGHKHNRNRQFTIN